MVLGSFKSLNGDSCVANIEIRHSGPIRKILIAQLQRLCLVDSCQLLCPLGSLLIMTTKVSLQPGKLPVTEQGSDVRVKPFLPSLRLFARSLLKNLPIGLSSVFSVLPQLSDAPFLSNPISSPFISSSVIPPQKNFETSNSVSELLPSQRPYL